MGNALTRTPATAGRGAPSATATDRLEIDLTTSADPSGLREAATRLGEVLESMAVGYLAMDHDWRITYVNAEGRRVLGATGRELVGEVLWDLYPATIGTEFERNYRLAAETGQVVTFDAYYPEPLDAWFELRATPETGGLGLYFLDVTARRAAEAARDLAAHRLQGLAQAALALVEATTVTDLARIVAEQSLSALGADGGALAVFDPSEPGVLLSVITSSFGQEAEASYSRLPLDADLPVCRAATTQERVLLADRAASVAFSAPMEQVNTSTGCQAWASLPLLAAGHVVGVLTAGWREPQAFTDGQVAPLEAFAAQCAQVLQRLSAVEAERTASAQVARFSETLQRSLLPSTPELDHLQVAVRYAPAAAGAYVGGDWYDAFITADGVTSLVVGDVTGHDRYAAAAMAQLRNLLRGIGYAVGHPPAAVLSALDHAISALGVEALATITLMQVGPPAEHCSAGHTSAGSRLLRWSNAGHPPPLLLGADGRTHYLEHEPDLLIGLAPDTSRHDHTALLYPGDSVLLFTDGLVERRGADLGTGFDWLAAAAAELTHLPLADLCEALLRQVGGGLEDDVALLALRAEPDAGTRHRA